MKGLLTKLNSCATLHVSANLLAVYQLYQNNYYDGSRFAMVYIFLFSALKFVIWFLYSKPDAISQWRSLFCCVAVNVFNCTHVELIVNHCSSPLCFLRTEGELPLPHMFYALFMLIVLLTTEIVSPTHARLMVLTEVYLFCTRIFPLITKPGRTECVCIYFATLFLLSHTLGKASGSIEKDKKGISKQNEGFVIPAEDVTTSMIPQGFLETLRSGRSMIFEVYILNGSFHFRFSPQSDISEGSGSESSEDVRTENTPMLCKELTFFSAQEHMPQMLKKHRGANTVFQIENPSISTILGLPHELGTLILLKLNISETLSLRSLSRETCAWIDGCLPYFTRLSWGTRAACTQAEQRLCSLLDKYGMSNLRSIDWRFGRDMYSVSTLSRLVPACATLRELCLNYSESVDDFFITAFARNCPNLQKLDVRACASVTSGSIKAVALHCPGLTRLDMSRCLLVDTDAVVLLAEKCAGLQHLNVSLCEIADEALFALAWHSVELRYLNVFSCRNLTDAGLQSVGSRCLQLQHLVCGSNRGLTDCALTCCQQSLRSLSIEATNASDHALSLLGKHCTALQALNITSCLKVTDTGISYFAEQCPTLEQINLSYCPNVTDSAILQLVQFCPSLKELLVSGCTGVTDTSLTVVAERCFQLQVLDVFACQLVSDESLCLLGLGCPELKKVNFSRCPMVTDLSVVSLAAYCRNLTQVNLTGCYQVQDDAVQLLVESCPTLKSLTLSNSARRVASFKQMMRNASQRDLDVVLLEDDPNSQT